MPDPHLQLPKTFEKIQDWAPLGAIHCIPATYEARRPRRPNAEPSYDTQALSKLMNYSKWTITEPKPSLLGTRFLLRWIGGGRASNIPLQVALLASLIPVDV